MEQQHAGGRIPAPPWTTGQIARMAGVTVRTVRYYDEIGLLHPARQTPAGYRQYAKEELAVLREIVSLRKAGASLSEIRDLLADPHYNRTAWLAARRNALLARKRETEEMIMEVERQLREERQDPHAQEAKERWEDTQAYAQYAARKAAMAEEERSSHAARFEKTAKSILQRLARLEAEDPGAQAVQNLIDEWQNAITENWYDCTDEILAALGQMYTCDPRFSAWICQYGSENLAAFFAQAIEIRTRRTCAR